MLVVTAPPGNRTRNYQSATHFYSKDGGATWAWTGDSAGVVASCDPLSPKGQQCPGKEASDDCPDDLVCSQQSAIACASPATF